MKIIKALFRLISTVLSLFVFLALLGSIYEYIHTTSPVTNSCSHSSVKDFEVNICTYRGSSNPMELVTYDFNQDRVLILTGDNSFDSKEIAFFKNSLKDNIGEAKKIKNIKIIAHSNLIPTPPSIDNVSKSQYCQRRGLKSNSSECLGILRALNVKTMLTELGYRKQLISTSYSKDPFLDSVNIQLNGTLLTVLELQSDIKALKEDLNISKSYSVSKLRKRYENESDLFDNHKDRLEPYNSTVLLVSFKN